MISQFPYFSLIFGIYWIWTQQTPLNYRNEWQFDEDVNLHDFLFYTIKNISNSKHKIINFKNLFFLTVKITFKFNL